MVKKVTTVEKIGKKNIIISGITKGSGMIVPIMATTLGFLVTNVNMSKSVLQCLHNAANVSYNMLSVDTDTLQTICYFVLQQVNIWQLTNQIKLSLQISRVLNEAAIDLAKQIAKDGEGAKKHSVDVIVQMSINQAQKVAKMLQILP